MADDLEAQYRSKNYLGPNPAARLCSAGAVSFRGIRGVGVVDVLGGGFGGGRLSGAWGLAWMLGPSWSGGSALLAAFRPPPPR